jgi:DNA invertase Pin-like site-specific DNA recombinase
VNTVNQTNVRSDSPRAVTYLRVGSGVRADWQHDLAVQREACQRHAERLGVEIAEEFVDLGASGNDKGRGGLRRLLALVTRRPIEYLIVRDRTRLASNPADDTAIRQHLKQAGVTTVLADTERRPR